MASMLSSREDVLSDGQRRVGLPCPTVEGGAARLEMEMSVWVDSVQLSTYLPPKYERERVRRHLTRGCWTEKRIA